MSDVITRGATVMVVALLLSACGDGTRSDAPVVADATENKAAASVPPVPAATPDAAPAATVPSFVGTWTGPEGLSFVVEPAAGGGFEVRNQDTLDEKTTFAARQEGATLRFVRRGQALVARPGTGEETGFKWLANKRDCLIVQPGVEGYCRD